MNNSSIDNEIKRVCPFCGKKYILRHFTYPCNLEDKHRTIIICPYCNKDIESIRVQGNEDVDTIVLAN